MSLKAKVYNISCDEPGCDEESAGSLEQLNRDGWRHKVMRQGKGIVEELAPYANNFKCMCGGCVSAAQEMAKGQV